MKKIKIVTSLLALFIMFPYQISAQSDVECPNTDHLEETSLKDKDGLLQALKKIVPETYGDGDYGNYYSEWEVNTALPFPETDGEEKDEAYEMSTNFCGEAVTDQSWFVSLHFPRWEGKSASATESQLFLAKSKEDGWFVWFRDQ